MSGWTTFVEAQGRRVAADSRHAICLHEPNQVWLVVQGQVDIFYAKGRGGKPDGLRKYVVTVEAGQAFFGMTDELLDGMRGLFAVGDPETVVYGLGKQAFLDELARAPEAQLIENWVQALTRAIAPAFTPQQFEDTPVGEVFCASAGQYIRPSEHVLWLKHQSGGSAYLSQTNLYCSPADPYIPLVRDTWLEMSEPRK